MWRVCSLVFAIAACASESPRLPGASAGPSSPPPARSSASTPAPVASPAPPAEGPWGEQLLTWEYASSAVGKTSVVVFSPKTSVRLPVLVALHGLGEAEKGPARGARGWVDDYGLLQALARLEAPPLTRADMQELGTPEHLASVNAQLAAERYRGLVIVCPYTPNILVGSPPLDAARPLGKFLTEEVLPRVVRELPADPAPAATGIDGVSLGGRAALLVGLELGARFGTVASLQAAIYENELDELARRAEKARAEHPELVLRLLTSSADFYRDPLQKLSKRLHRRGVPHHFTLVERGPHSYLFNRGLGVYEMLLFHDRALRGQAAQAAD